MTAPRPISTPEHTVTIIVGGYEVRAPEAYEITTSMIDPCGRFTMRWSFDRDMWDLVKPDSPITVLIDGTKVLTGFIDERYVPDDGNDVVEITGRDRAGRLVDESCPGVNFDGLTMKDVIKAALDPWFKTLEFSNASNRKIQRGRGVKAKAFGEPLIIASDKKIGTHIEPGQARRTVIEQLCSQAGYLAFAACDGSHYVVGLPNYNQEIQFRFFMPASGSLREGEATVRGMGVHESTAERYSRIIVAGSGTGTGADYGDTVASRYGQAKNNDATPEGTGLDFTAPKRLIIKRSAKSPDEANDLAEREMAKRDSHGKWVSVRAAGHGQLIGGAYTTLFAPDTMSSVEDERTGTQGEYLLTECVYRGSRDGAAETSIHLVPKHSVLA